MEEILKMVKTNTNIQVKDETKKDGTVVQKIDGKINYKNENIKGFAIGHIRDKHGIRVQTEKPVLTIFVAKKKILSEVPKDEVIPTKVDEYETDVVEIGEIKAQDTRAINRPFSPGDSLGNINITAGTTSFGLIDPIDKQIYVLTNAHVACADPFVDVSKQDKRVCQAGPTDLITSGHPALADYIIGELKTFTKLNNGGVNSRDSAVVRLGNKDYFKPENSKYVLPVGVTGGSVGEKVVKSDTRTTNATEGTITYLNASVRVSYGDGKTVTQIGQTITTCMSKGGDSGSAIYKIVDGKPYAYGLLFAGSDTTTIITPIVEAISVYGLDLITGDNTPPEPPEPPQPPGPGKQVRTYTIEVNVPILGKITGTVKETVP